MIYKMKWWNFILLPLLLSIFFILISFTVLSEFRNSRLKNVLLLSQEVVTEWNAMDVATIDLLLKHQNNPYGDRTELFKKLVFDWKEKRVSLNKQLNELSIQIGTLELNPDISIITEKTISLWTLTDDVFSDIDSILKEIIDIGFAEKLVRGSLIEEFYKLRLLKRIKPEELQLGVKLISSIKILDDAGETFDSFLNELIQHLKKMIEIETRRFNFVFIVDLVVIIIFIIIGLSWKRKIVRYTQEKKRLEEVTERSTFRELFIKGVTDTGRQKKLLTNLGFDPNKKFYFLALTIAKHSETLRSLGRLKFNEAVLSAETIIKKSGKSKDWVISGYNVDQNILFVLQSTNKSPNFIEFSEEVIREAYNNTDLLFYAAASNTEYSGESPDTALSLIRKLLEERYRLKEPGITWLEQLPEVPEVAFIFPVDKEARLCEKLKLCKQDEAELLFNEIMEDVIPYGYRVYKAVILRLIVTLSNLLEDLFDLRSEENNTDVLTLIFELEGLDTAEEIGARFKEVFQLIIISLNKQRSGSQSRIIDQVRSIIQKEYMNLNLSADFIADQLGFSTGYLMKVFRSVSSHSIQKEINQFRLNKATEIIINSDKPMAQVALESGFLNSNYFFTLFKKYFGKTPGEYKKENLQ
ncbi:MAG: AraC family transcriptional regulator [Spirochaetaceae bacterium]